MTARWSSPAGALTLAGVLIGSAVLGFLFHRLTTRQAALRPAPPAAAASATQVSPGPSPRSTPEKLPDVTLPDTQGKPHHLREWAGQPLLINFWATWCEPCRREVPLLEELSGQKHGNGFEIVGIAIDNLDSVQQFAHDMHIGYPILVGEQGGLEAAAAFGSEPVLPFTAFVDSRGDVVALKRGELHRDEATFILARLADLDAGRLSLAASRARISEELRRLALSRVEASSAPSASN